MPLLYLLEGIAVGFVGAMPIGPIGVLCIRRALTLGRKQGIVTGLGGATADIFYVTTALFGIKLIADFVALEQLTIRLCGGIGILAMGIFVVRSHPSSRLFTETRFEHTRLYISTFLLALTNPLPLLGFAAMLSAIGITHIAEEIVERILFIAGVFLGSLIWFSLLANIANAIRHSLTDEKLSIINKVAGIILIVMGLVAAISSVGRL